MQRQQRGVGQLLLAEIGGRPVGHIYIWREPADEEQLRACLPDVPLLMNLWVHKDFRRRGIGTRLVEAAEHRLLEAGHGQVALGVEPDNNPAVGLYIKALYDPWPHEDLKTHYDAFNADGTHEVRWEICAVLVKDLSGTTAEVAGRRG
jgi:GNAT superfamily N-acetyltransferase